MLDSTGQPFTINSREELREDYTEIEKEVLDAYGVEIWGDLFPDGDQFPVKPWGVAWEINWDASSPINVPFQQIQDTMYTRIPEAILTEPGNFDSVYDRFMDEIEAHGVYEMEEHFTELIKNE
ncbi:hypothetical protein [Bacillus sp. JCM 19034]|uniref:hypothetical protein n=1 Tax=Bacillus sp. JCM 19034 TaxID=1481928 RepID=UPI000ABC4089|nr:hypothetical protein [Bacillus sp. JCM 19034]